MTSYVSSKHYNSIWTTLPSAWATTWTTERDKMLLAWQARVAAVQASPPPAGTGLEFTNPVAFYNSAAKSKTDAELLMSGLEGLFVKNRPAFDAWLWLVISNTGWSLLYEQLLARLDSWDIQLTRRLAALVYHVGVNHPPSSSPLHSWAKEYRPALVATGHTAFSSAGAVLLVPGRSSINSGYTNGNAAGPSHARATYAKSTISWLVPQLPSGKKLVVVCSGGMVRSPTPESRFMANALNTWLNPKPWKHKVVIREDALARHTASNARTMARLALLAGIKPARIWVVTAPGQMGKFQSMTMLGNDWEEHCMTGLEAPDRAALEWYDPVDFAPASSVPWSIAQRARLSILRGMALVPAPGNALDP